MKNLNIFNTQNKATSILSNSRRFAAANVRAPAISREEEISVCSTQPPQCDTTRLMSMLKQRVGGKPLRREWYASQEMFQADMKYVWGRSWLFAGFECQIPKSGSYLTYKVGNESILIVRGDDNVIRAFFNVCRHRGARLCSKENGELRTITCPYHAWSYSKTGDLVKATHMEGQIDFANYGLIKCQIRCVEGLIFINLCDDPLPFDPAAALIGPEMKHHLLQDAKIAHVSTDIVNANWKLVYENNRECYHCPISHPDYIKANYDLSFVYQPQDDGTFVRSIDPNVKHRSDIEEFVQGCSTRWEKYGVKCATDNSFPGDGWYRASRMPLKKGWFTESLDGKPVAPIMGSFAEEDRNMGSLRIHTLPNFWIHVSSDYAAAARLTPIDPLRTRVDQYWLVAKHAQEGVDYHLDTLLPFWKNTNEADWEICELNQAGVLSDRYDPAPYSVKKEGGVETFVKWYLKTMQKGIVQQESTLS